MPRFPYTRTSIPLSETFVKFKNSPILKVGLLSASGQMVKVESYIDTGAQLCLFDNSYAKYLGIKDFKNVKCSEDIVPLSGVGGRAPSNTAYCYDLKLLVFKDPKHLELKNALQIIETKIGFIEKSIAVAGILGVYGFLDQFTFKCNIPQGYFEIEPLFEV